MNMNYTKRDLIEINISFSHRLRVPVNLKSDCIDNRHAVMSANVSVFE